MANFCEKIKIVLFTSDHQLMKLLEIKAGIESKYKANPLDYFKQNKWKKLKKIKCLECERIGIFV